MPQPNNNLKKFISDYKNAYKGINISIQEILSLLRAEGLLEVALAEYGIKEEDLCTYIGWTS